MFPVACLDERFPLSPCKPDRLSLPASPCKDDNFEGFKKWVISTYGDGSKTKTITW